MRRKVDEVEEADEVELVREGFGERGRCWSSAREGGLSVEDEQPEEGNRREGLLILVVSVWDGAKKKVDQREREKEERGDATYFPSERSVPLLRKASKGRQESQVSLLVRRKVKRTEEDC